MVEIKNLCVGYAGKQILHDICMTAHAGQITAILGPNGCGKSTLLKSICGILPQTSGQILLDRQNLFTLSQKQVAQKVAYLAQSRQIPDITVERLVLHGRFPYLNYPRQYRQEDYQIANNVMRQLQILDLADTRLCQLSGGQQQKAYLAMALAQDTAVILMDEPATYLDIAFQFQLLRQARDLAGCGKHVIMVTHDLCRALETADRVVLMNAGMIIAQGPPEEIYRCGALEDVFQIKVIRVNAADRWHYLCVDN